MMFLLLCVADTRAYPPYEKKKGGQLTALILAKLTESGFFLLAAMQATFFQTR